MSGDIAPGDYWRKVTPVKRKISCKMADCEYDLHCFRRIRPIGKTYRNIVCNQCGADLIDWNRIDRRDLTDVDYTFKALKHEMVRHYFWHIDIDDKILKKAQRKGINGLLIWTKKRLDKYLRPPSKKIYPWDGTQTPKTGNIVYYAQYATSTCCRLCLEEWYGIDRHRPLSDEETDYFLELIMMYVREKLPNLSTNPIKI